MRKTILTALAFTAVLGGQAQHRADQQQLDNPESFSMIVLGDPQGYMKYDINQPLFELCTAWIADNVDHLNIKSVLCTGDLVETNECITRIRTMVNQTSREQWECVSRCFGRLDNKVPYIISPGNHDYGYRSAENGRTEFPKYFPLERNEKLRDVIVSDYPNRMGDISTENGAFRIEAPGWGHILIVCAEFAPRDEVLEWAKKVISDPKYKDDKVIFLTHSYMRERTGALTDNEGYKIRPANWGKQIWEKLIQPLPNVDMVICGHTGKPGEFEDATAYVKSKNAAGNTVHQMMFNVQILGGGWEGNGGDGWVRILEFYPDGKTIHVKTYSPLFGISPTTKEHAYRKGKLDDYKITIE